MSDIDRDRARAFAQRMVSTYSEAMTVMFVAIGRQTGLLDQLAAGPSDAASLASATGMAERYVLEWLRGLTTAGIVETDSDGLFSLPPEHAMSLTGDSFLNTSAMAQVIADTGRHLDDAVMRFTSGDGQAFHEQGEMVSHMHDMSRARFDTFLTGSYLPSVDGLLPRLQEGIRVVDIGCGTGHAVVLMARAFPDSEIVGLDLSPESIARGRAAAEEAGVNNATFVQQTIADLDGSYDLVTAFDVIHDLGDPAGAVAAVRGALGEDGVFLMAESSAPASLADQAELPWAPLMYGFSAFGCIPSARSQGGEGVGTMWGQAAAEALLRDAGFTTVRAHRMKGDPMNALYEARV